MSTLSPEGIVFFTYEGGRVKFLNKYYPPKQIMDYQRLCEELSMFSEKTPDMEIYYAQVYYNQGATYDLKPGAVYAKNGFIFNTDSNKKKVAIVDLMGEDKFVAFPSSPSDLPQAAAPPTTEERWRIHMHRRDGSSFYKDFPLEGLQLDRSASGIHIYGKSVKSARSELFWVSLEHVLFYEVITVVIDKKGVEL